MSPFCDRTLRVVSPRKRISITPRAGMRGGEYAGPARALVGEEDALGFLVQHAVAALLEPGWRKWA